MHEKIDQLKTPKTKNFLVSIDQTSIKQRSSKAESFECKNSQFDWLREIFDRSNNVNFKTKNLKILCKKTT